MSKSNETHFTNLSKLFFGLGLIGGSISVVITFLNWASPEIFENSKINVPSFTGGMTILSAVSFLLGLWMALHILRDDLKSFSNKVEGDLGRFSGEIKQDTTTGQKIYDALQTSGFLNREILKLVKPKIIEDFEETFERAKHIHAYNPPLGLLIDSPKHRRVIENVLNNTGRRYQIIAGPTCRSRLKELKAIWTAELSDNHQPDAISKILTRMEILVYQHDGDLHSEVGSWLNRQNDLRGLCFFLIDNGQDKTVLMYILGSPFVESFDVPSTAISINSGSDRFELFNSMLNEYENRWGRLSAIAKENDETCIRTNLFEFDAKS